MKDYKKLYEERMAKAKAKVMGSSIIEELEIAKISNSRINEICAKMEEILGKKPWNNFNFRTGKIFGILQTISMNQKFIDELLQITGLSREHIDAYFMYCGNLPYVDNTQNNINIGRQMDVEATREFIPVVAEILGVLVEDKDIADITQERWDNLYQNALERAKQTVEFTANQGDIPESYDE